MKKFVSVLMALAMMLSVCTAFADGVRVATIGPLTGPYAIYGTNVANALVLAAEEINALGGVQLEVLDAQDDQGDPTSAVNAYNNLMDSGMQILLGTVTSGACIATGTQANEDRTFLLTPSASSDLVIADKDNVFQICFTDSNQGSASAQYIFDHKLATKVGVIYNNAIDYSIGIRNTFVAKCQELGIEVAAEEAFSDDNNADYSVQVASMKNADVDLVFLPIYYTPASQILKKASEVGLDVTFFGVDGMDGILNLEGFDTSLAEGVLLLTPFSANSTEPRTAAFVARYQEMYKDTPNQFAADAYDAAYVITALIEKTGITAETSPEEACELLIAAITADDFSYEGITGSMKWDATGAVTKTPQAVVISNGEYVINE